MSVCEGSGFHIDGRLWPLQLEVGYATAKEQTGECIETINGLRIGLENTSKARFSGLQVGIANESNSVDGVRPTQFCY